MYTENRRYQMRIKRIRKRECDSVPVICPSAGCSKPLFEVDRKALARSVLRRKCRKCKKLLITIISRKLGQEAPEANLHYICREHGEDARIEMASIKIFCSHCRKDVIFHPLSLLERNLYEPKKITYC
jgi:hypothetical protein